MPLIDHYQTTNGLSALMQERDFKALIRPVKRIPLFIKEARGAKIIDIEGREVIDLTSGWNVVNAGWNNPDVIAAIEKQLKSTLFAPPWCSHEAKVVLAEKITSLLNKPGQKWKCFSSVSGSEAVEIALRAAKLFTGRKGIIGFQHAYHGHTLGAIMAGGVEDMIEKSYVKDQIHRKLPMPNDNFSYAGLLPLIDEEFSKEDKPAAILLETIFTNPGVITPADRSFFKHLTVACKKYDVLLICDEVGTGYCRTGKNFAFEHFDFVPDIIATAKALGNGMPISTTIVKEEISRSMTGPGFSCTFGWTPICTAAAIANLNFLIDNNCNEMAEYKGNYFKEKLIELQHSISEIYEVRGIGLEIGIELRDEGKHVERKVLDSIVSRLLGEGVFLEPSSSFSSTLLIMPPLVISAEEIDFCVDKIKVVLSKTFY